MASLPYIHFVRDEIAAQTTRYHDRAAHIDQSLYILAGWDTTVNKRGFCVREKGDSHWQSQTRLDDFDDARRFFLEGRFKIDLLSQEDDGWTIHITDGPSRTFYGKAYSPARAVAAAWLSWMESIHG